jgi:hypothetical protein
MICLIIKEDAKRMKSFMLAGIMLAITLLPIYIGMTMAEPENQADGHAIVPDFHNNSSTSEMANVLITPEIFDIPGFSSLISNKTANYYYSKVIYYH